MRQIITLSTSMLLALAMLIAPDMRAQSRSTGSASRSTSSQSSSSSSTRSSGSSSSTRSSGTVQQNNNTRSSSSSSSAGRSSGTVQQNNNTRSGSSTSSNRSGSTSSTVRSSGSNGSSSGSTVRSSGSSSGSTVRSSGSSSSVSSSNNASRSSSSSSSVSGSGVSSSGNASSRASASGNGVTPSHATANSPDNVVQASNVSRSGLGNYNDNKNVSGDYYRDEGGNYRYHDDMRVDSGHNLLRVAPRHRDPMPWDRPGYFWGDVPHYYGYRITSLPPQWRRISHWGFDYYFYNGIYYRSFGGSYVICRPPFGTPLEAAIDRAILRAIRFAYYCDTYRTYSRTFDYYNVIARQNLIIAQQNARLAAQNAAYAINSSRALTAYELAQKLGLVQSYAYANSQYYYQDGVFYTISASGQYTTIVPPAGALVTSLPDDYEVIVMNGIEYYMVDNTVYRTTLFEGMPYLEVLGQMYGSLYNQYNVYR